jgi:mono/diheme cytochrome c family protein
VTNDKGFVVVFFLGVVILAGGFYYYFAEGMAPVATADAPMPFEKKLANRALDARIEKRHVGQSPVKADETTLLAGAEIYKSKCAACHGILVLLR